MSQTLKAALLGRSLAHSISDQAHKAIFQVMQPRYSQRYDAIEYALHECPTEEAFVDAIKSGVIQGVRGYNVTFPYKELASRLRGEVDPLAKAIFSANTILLSTTSLSMYTTDGIGFRESLRKECPDLDPAGYHVIVLGAGGAARAVVDVLHSMGWAEMTACARSVEHAHRAFGHYGIVAIRSIDQLVRDRALPHIVVQATPVGQRSSEILLADFDWQPGDIAVDLVYNPQQTRFLGNAAGSGARTISGLGMLIEQAALSQYIWMKGEPLAGSPLREKEYQHLYETLSPAVTPRWDASAI